MSSERRCLVVGADAAVNAAVASVIDTASGLTAAGMIDPAIALSGVRPACDAVLVCDAPGQPALEIGSALIRSGAESPVILLSRSTDVATFRAALALGARGLLAMPPDPHELRAAVLDAVAARAPRDAPSRPSGHAVVVCAAKGGGGASSVALSLAVAACGLLVDLADGFDDAAARLACEPRRTLADVAGLDDALGAEALRSLALRHPSGLSLIARPAVASAAGLISPVLGHALVRECRVVSPLAVLDTGAAGSEITVSIAQPADRVLLTTTPDKLSVECAARAARWLEGAGVPAPSMGLVVNRWSKWEDMTLRGIERRTGVPLLAVVRDGELVAGQMRPPASLAALASDLQSA